jgi:hypothetical protein
MPTLLISHNNNVNTPRKPQHSKKKSFPLPIDTTNLGEAKYIKEGKCSPTTPRPSLSEQCQFPSDRRSIHSQFTCKSNGSFRSKFFKRWLRKIKYGLF